VSRASDDLVAFPLEWCVRRYVVCLAP
jgi:hypothetical protein